MANRTSVFLLILSLFLSVGCGDKIDPGTRETAAASSVKAEVETARFTKQALIYRAVGTVKARTESTLASKLMGVITTVKVQEGDKVLKGDLLAGIDDRQVVAGMMQAEAALTEAQRAVLAAESARDAAKATEQLGRATYERYQKLRDDEAVSPQEFEEVQSRFLQSQAAVAQTEAMVKTAHARVRQAKAGVAAASVSRKDAEIRAPYAGTITAKMVEPGNLAAPGSPLFTLETSESFRVDLVIPEAHIGSLSIGQNLKVHIESLSSQPIEGSVYAIFPSADIGSRSFTAKVTIDPIPGLRSGLFARVSIPLTPEPVLAIPRSALVRSGQLTGIYILGSENTVRFRLVRTGRDINDRIEILSGLKDGERFVVQPPPELSDGSRIEVAS